MTSLTNYLTCSFILFFLFLFIQEAFEISPRLLFLDFLRIFNGVFLRVMELGSGQREDFEKMMGFEVLEIGEGL